MTAPSGFSGYRHLYTGSTVGAGGTSGFQTVAQAPELEAHRGFLESLVEGYRSTPEEGPFRTYQLHGLTGAPDYSVLSWLEPRGEMPDGREGNTWAESLVVPSDWLAQAFWDLDAALGILEGHWLGPSVLEQIQSWPHGLEPFPLPSLEPAGLDRLGFLAEVLSPQALYALVRGVVRQFRSRASVAFVAGEGHSDPVLEQILRRTPLLLPPNRRLARGDREDRPLRICTLDRPDRPFAADFLGVPHGWQGSLDEFQGEVLYLGDPSSAVFPVDSYGLAYTQWLCEVIQQGRWSELEGLYSEHQIPSETDGIEHFKPDPQRVDRGSASDSPKTRKAWAPGMRSLGSPGESFREALERRKVAWEMRDEAERLMDDLREQFRKDLEQLSEAFEHQLVQLLAEQRSRLEGLKREAEQASHEMQKEVDSISGNLRAEQQRQHERLLQMQRSYKKELQDQSQRYLLSLSQAFGQHQEGLQRGFEGQLDQRERTTGGVSWEEGPDGSSVGAPQTAWAEQGTGSAKGFWDSLQESLKSLVHHEKARYVVGVAVMVIAVAGVIFHFMGGSDGPTDGTTSGTVGGPTSSTAGSTPASGSSDAFTALKETLREPQIFRSVLAQAEERRDLGNWPMALAMVQAETSLSNLGEWKVTPVAGQPPKDEGCLLMQAALGIGVDGQCGGGSEKAIRERAQQIRKAGAASTAGSTTAGEKTMAEEAVFVLQAELGLPEDCQVSWGPLTFNGPCVPSPEGARALVSWGKAVPSQQTLPVPVATVLESTLGLNEELKPGAETLLFRIAHRLCTEGQDLGADAASSLPTLEDLNQDAEALEASLESVQQCLEGLSGAA